MTVITGVSGRAMLDAIVSSVNEPVFLAEMAKSRLKGYDDRDYDPVIL
jgi:pantothenate kinase-related protein Tda10